MRDGGATSEFRAYPIPVTSEAACSNSE